MADNLIERAKQGGFFRAAMEAGAVVSGGPVPDDFTAAWGVVPLMSGSVAHHWTADRPGWLAEVGALYGLHSACGITSIGTKRLPLLGAGNMRYCTRCEALVIRRFQP